MPSPCLCTDPDAALLAVLDHPERWDDVLALLGKPPVGGVR